MKSKITKFLVVCVLLFLSYYAYIHYIGIPKTLARQYYLKAQNYRKFGNYEKYTELLSKSKSFFPEEYILTELTKFLKTVD